MSSKLSGEKIKLIAGDIVENTCYHNFILGTQEFSAELPYLKPEDIDKEFRIETSKGLWNIATEMEPHAQWNASTSSLVGSGGHLAHDPLSLSREWSQPLRRQQDNNIYTDTQTTLQSDISGDVLQYFDVECPMSACNIRKADLTYTSHVFPTYEGNNSDSHNKIASPEGSRFNPGTQCSSHGNYSQVCAHRCSSGDQTMSECSDLTTNTSPSRSTSGCCMKPVASTEHHTSYTEALQCLSLNQRPAASLVEQEQIQQDTDIFPSTPTSYGLQSSDLSSANEPTLMSNKAAISQYYLNTLPLFSEVGQTHTSHISIAQSTTASMVSDATRSPNYSLVSPSNHLVNLYWPPPYQSTSRTTLPLTHAPFGEPAHLIDNVVLSHPPTTSVEAGQTFSLSHEAWPKNCPSELGSSHYQGVARMDCHSRQPQRSKEVGLLDYRYSGLEQPHCSNEILEPLRSNPHQILNHQQMTSNEVCNPIEMRPREYHCSNEAVLPLGQIEMESHCSSEVGLPLDTNEVGLLRYAARLPNLKIPSENGQAEAANHSPSHFSPSTTTFSPNLSPIASNFSPIASNYSPVASNFSPSASSFSPSTSMFSPSASVNTSNFSPRASLSHEYPLASQMPSPPPKHVRKTSSSRHYSNSSVIDGSPANSEQSSSCSSSTADASEYSKLHRTRSVDGKSRKKKKKSTVQQQQWSKTMNPLNLLAFRQLIISKLKKYSEPEQKEK